MIAQRRQSRRLRVLIGCEFSGVVRRAFRKRGHAAYSCDTRTAADNSPFHYQCDVLDVIDRGWDLAIFHPPCTFLTVAANAWYYHPDDKHLPYDERRPHPNYPTRREDRERAVEFVELLLAADIPHIALENPIGILSTRIRKPEQIIQPYRFGDDASKATCLWTKNLPRLHWTRYVQPRITADGKKRWANQTDSGQNRLGPSEDREMIRSTTYPGIARAWAMQWGDYCSAANQQAHPPGDAA